MGFFDNLKKKKEAKELGLSVEQYDEFVIAQSLGISLTDYRRFCASFSDKYTLKQFLCYLRLEKTGISEKLCIRYLAELSEKVALEDYVDFLAAEQLGLSVSQYVAYASSLKGSMSLKDYIGFLQAQKMGIPLEKYLKYLKLFKNKITLDEYCTYLRAEKRGMDYARYIEYLQKYKEQYTIERYLEFDKARSLGMSLEEYDLRIEASKAGMPLEEYQDHLKAKSLGLAEDEYAIYKEILAADCIHNNVFAIPEKFTALPRNVFRHLQFSRVIFPANISEIAKNAFEGCLGLYEVVIPATIQVIGAEAFKGCSSLTSVIIEPGTELIQEKAFENCISLTQVHIPGTVKTVDYRVFCGCTSLQEVQFENGTQNIDISDWVELPALSNVVMPASASLRHLPPFRSRDVRYGIINKDYRWQLCSEQRVDRITAANYSEYGLSLYQSEIEYLEVYGDYVFLELSDFPKLKTVVFPAKGRVESIQNCPSLQMIYYHNYMEEITPETLLVYKGLQPPKATISLRDFDAPCLRFLAVENGVRKIDFAHYSQRAFALTHIHGEESGTESVEEIPVPKHEEIDSAQTAEVVTETQGVRVVVAQQFSMNIPKGYIYSTESAAIGENRTLVAIRDSTDANYWDPYGTSESITVLLGKPIRSTGEADAIAASIGLADAQILTDNADLNVRYLIGESTEELTIILALICTGSRSFPVQFFYNGKLDIDAVSTTRNALLSVKIIEKAEESPSRCRCTSETPNTISIAQAIEKDDSYETSAVKPYPPGKEPEKLRLRVERFFEKLKSAYPDGVVIGLDRDHAHWAEAAVILYRELGYENRKDFFAAYGYSVGISESKGGRPPKDHMAVVEELKRRYASGPSCATVEEIKLNNPDLAPRIKNLQNQAKKFFGMPLSQYFVQEGILGNFKNSEAYIAEFDKLKSRYIEKPYTGTLNELRSINADIDWNAINKYYARAKTLHTFRDFLISEGIIAEEESVEVKLAEIMKELRKRYPPEKQFDGKIDELKAENMDLPVGNLSVWTMQLHKLSVRDYLIRQGIMKEAKSVEDKLAEVTSTLKMRYASGEKKAYTITDLREQNLDLPINTIGTWSKKVYGQNASEYLTAQGILSEYDWMVSMRLENERREAEAKAREEKQQAELKNPISPTYYEPQVYYVEEISVSGKEAEDWKTVEYWTSHPGEIFIEDYLGTQEHIVIPVEINGKKVSGISSFAFKTCKAKTVEIPGFYKKVSHGFAFQNQNITSAVIGEGIEVLEDSVFFNTPNLEKVKVSKSVGMVYGNCAFKSTKWYSNQGDYVIVGTVLLYFKGDGAVINVPNGITTVAELVAVSKDIQKVILPETVTTLCKRAFFGRGNDNIHEFVFTESLVNIGNQALGRNKWLDSFGNQPVIINNQLYSCKVTESVVVVQEGIVKICTEVFKDNTTIKKVILPKTLKIIDEQAFSGCSNLTAIELPAGIEQLGVGCFAHCNKLKLIHLPDSLIEIGHSAFYSCGSLTEIAIGLGTEIIGEKAFSDCRMLQVVRMHDGVKHIGKAAFRGCRSLQTIHLSTSICQIGEEAFSECTSLADVRIPVGVISICTLAFMNCKALRSVEIPEGMKEIADSAFKGCISLREIKLPERIGQRAFEDCKALATAVFSGRTELIPDYCFAGCESLENVVLPESLKEIGISSFNGCIKIAEIIIPKNVFTIKADAFRNCTALESVDMQGEVAEFGIDVFTNSPYMKKTFGDFVIVGGVLSKYLGKETEVVIPGNVKTIGENAFAESRHVRKIVIPDTVTSIDKKIMGDVYTWSNNQKPQLKTLVIGDGVSEIGEEAFSDCEKLAEINFGKGLKVIGSKAFAGCTALTAIDLSVTTITEVKQEAFRGCYNVKKLTLPETVEIIGRNAFSGIYINKIVLPKTIRTVERSSFDGTSELIVYDTIDPDAVEATQWKYDYGNGSVNSALACAMLGVPQSYVECQGNTTWRGYHITVLSAESGNIRYRIYCDCEERETYRAMMFSAWGKHASFTFEPYDAYFMRTRNMLGRTEMAFCRIEYPEGLSAKHRANYEAFLERCMFIERSAKRTAEMIARTDAVERLKILHQYRAIDEHNIGWIREQLEAKHAVNCLHFLDETFSK